MGLSSAGIISGKSLVTKPGKGRAVGPVVWVIPEDLRRE
jgi:hypothetical protein